MVEYPTEPEPRHVWLRGQGGYGPPAPGVVVDGQHAPAHNATEAGWLVLVASSPFGSALLVEWVSAERLLGVRDARASTDGLR